MAKNKHVFIKIEKFKFPNIGIGRKITQEEDSCADFSKERNVEIKRALPGQLIEAKVKKGKGQLLNIAERGDKEISPLCPNADKCGGCTFQTLTYEDELNIKEQMVKDLFKKANIELPETTEVKPAPSVYGYRNKMEFSFGDECKDGPLSLGLRNPGSYYEVCDGSYCNICHEDFNKIVKYTRDFFRERRASFYHRTRHTGHLRHLVIRRGEHTGEILVNLVTTEGLVVEGFEKALLEISLEGRICGIIHTINNSVADAVKPEIVEVLYGDNYYYDLCLGLKFKIYPFSFFQTNTFGAEELYKTVKEFAEGNENGDIFDLYCGTGTIAQILSEKARKVYGIEIVESAVDAAIQNAAINNIENCEFIAGDVLKEVTKLTSTPETIILDPPREGIHPKALEPIINFEAKRIIYVSCKPTSLVRDLEVFLESGYRLKDFRIHDMFPRSYHVECVALLEKQM
ncbi:MAG: 23S rRNA (uracil(1939)-C(5))-methyltransferase RlmD [Defluviitaleaceae bacterium]|nr:23S rRNA (uracil(1939)-C(5))-methyltransferase RlmD [Defluviitaleaceae bacterium]